MSEQSPQAVTQAEQAMPSRIAVQLRHARVNAGLSHSELHRLTGISRPVLIGYEAGRTTPGGREMRKLCDALRVTPNQLVYGTEQPFEPDTVLKRLGLDANAITFAHMMVLWNMLAGDDRRALLTLMHSLLEARHGPEQMSQAADVMNEFNEFLAMAMEKIGFSQEALETAFGKNFKEIEAEAKKRFARFAESPQERPRRRSRKT